MPRALFGAVATVACGGPRRARSLAAPAGMASASQPHHHTCVADGSGASAPPRLRHPCRRHPCSGTLVPRGLTRSKAGAGLRGWSPVLPHETLLRSERRVSLGRSDQARSWMLQPTALDRASGVAYARRARHRGASRGYESPRETLHLSQWLLTDCQGFTRQQRTQTKGEKGWLSNSTTYI